MDMFGSVASICGLGLLVFSLVLLLFCTQLCCSKDTIYRGSDRDRERQEREKERKCMHAHAMCTYKLGKELEVKVKSLMIISRYFFLTQSLQQRGDIYINRFHLTEVATTSLYLLIGIFDVVSFD